MYIITFVRRIAKKDNIRWFDFVSSRCRFSADDELVNSKFFRKNKAQLYLSNNLKKIKKSRDFWSPPKTKVEENKKEKLLRTSWNENVWLTLTDERNFSLSLLSAFSFFVNFIFFLGKIIREKIPNEQWKCSPFP